jgi:exodeoxyribonuclease-5
MFSGQQEAAIKAVKSWMSDKDQQVFRLFGYAGTGKTTLARTFAREVKGNTLFCAFTGKAALMMRKKGCPGASTIHSLIYLVDEASPEWQPKWQLNPASEANNAKLIVVDECSMVDEALARDLLSFGKKILVLGDPAQLPPVKGAGFFIDAEPDVMLTEVHRQAAENPIIAMSMAVRSGERLEIGRYGDSKVIRRSDVDAEQILAADQVLVGVNRTRKSYNTRIRELKGHGPGPQQGDKLVCLKNDKEKKLLNGGLWQIEKIAGRTKIGTKLLISSEDHVERKPTKVLVRNEFFSGTEEGLSWEDLRGTDQFCYGYALTVHKSQGSQWNDVVVFDESHAFREHQSNHLYTAITRAAERVTVVV